MANCSLIITHHQQEQNDRVIQNTGETGAGMDHHIGGLLRRFFSEGTDEWSVSSRRMWDQEEFVSSFTFNKTHVLYCLILF